MSRCCDEPGCRRSQPIGLYLGDFSGVVYAVTWAEMRSPGHYTARQRHDVTAQMGEFIRRNSVWVRERLPENDGAPGYGRPVGEIDG